MEKFYGYGTVGMGEQEMVKLHGPLGSMLDNVVKNRLVKIDYGQLTTPFRLRNEMDNKWRCEFWGKVVRSAVYAWKSTQDPELKERIDHTVAEQIATQTPDGCISSYPGKKQLAAGTFGDGNMSCSVCWRITGK